MFKKRLQEKVTKFVNCYFLRIESKLEELEDNINNLENKKEAEIKNLTDLTYTNIRNLRNDKYETADLACNCGLFSDFIDDIDFHYNFINEALSERYPESLPKNIDREYLIKTFLSDKKGIKFDKNMIRSYKNKLEKYRKTKNLNFLYENNLKTKILSKEKGLTKERLKDLFMSLILKDSEELISLLNIFYEQYAITEYGSKHLELLNEEYIKNKRNNKNAEEIWIDKIFKVMSQYSTIQLYKKTGDVKSKSGQYYSRVETKNIDALFFINIKEYNEKQKEELSEIKTLKELKNFKNKNDKISKVIVIGVADKNIKREADSAIRHPLGCLLISAMLNQELNKNPEMLDLFNDSKTDKYLISGNKKMREAIVNSFENIFPNILEEKKTSFVKFNQIQHELLLNPVKYISKFIEKYASEIEDNEKEKNYIKTEGEDYLTEEDFEMLVKIENRNPVFKSKFFINLYRDLNVDKLRKIEDFDSNYKNVSILDLEEKESLFQYSKLIKNHYLSNMDNQRISSRICNRIADYCVKINISSIFKNIKANELREVKVNDIDCYILETFLLGKKTKENLVFLNSESQEDISEIVELIFINQDKEEENLVSEGFLVKNKIDTLNLIEKTKESFKEKIQLISGRNKSTLKSVFSIIENRKEKCAEKKRADLLEEENIKVKAGIEAKFKAEFEKKTKELEEKIKKELEEKIKKELEEKMKKELEEHKEKITKQAIKTNNKNKQ